MIMALPQAMFMGTNKLMCFCTTLLMGRREMKRSRRRGGEESLVMFPRTVYLVVPSFFDPHCMLKEIKLKVHLFYMAKTVVSR